MPVRPLRGEAAPSTRAIRERYTPPAAPARVTFEAWLDRLREDEAARTRLYRLLWYASTATTVTGFVLILILLRRQGVI